jgi:predicted nucleic acid-binding protein
MTLLVRTVDALIAESAVSHKAALATANFKHFKNVAGLHIIRFEP